MADNASIIIYIIVHDEFKIPGSYREDLSMSIGFGLFFGPAAVLIAIFFTGSAQYGWSLKSKNG